MLTGSRILFAVEGKLAATAVTNSISAEGRRRSIIKMCLVSSPYAGSFKPTTRRTGREIRKGMEESALERYLLEILSA